MVLFYVISFDFFKGKRLFPTVLRGCSNHFFSLRAGRIFITGSGFFSLLVIGISKRTARAPIAQEKGIVGAAVHGFNSMHFSCHLYSFF